MYVYIYTLLQGHITTLNVYYYILYIISCYPNAVSSIILYILHHASYIMHHTSCIIRIHHTSCTVNLQGNCKEINIAAKP